MKLMIFAIAGVLTVFVALVTVLCALMAKTLSGGFLEQLDARSDEVLGEMMRGGR